ncbi:hypothetical protein EUGRSUZ_H04801 [Eucalyptus grandis]|uniref:Uncharacterized protein n=2 Tax=Eucalyptus grandis TaxID=71139 RepID=A0ACC3JYP3_EUCGR|nr:hypothetical protein EUGRSUZ_H04801 [Eucalyptus grandis]
MVWGVTVNTYNENEEPHAHSTTKKKTFNYLPAQTWRAPHGEKKALPITKMTIVGCIGSRMFCKVVNSCCMAGTSPWRFAIANKPSATLPRKKTADCPL